MQKIKRYELIELSVKTGQSGRINFPSIPQLRNQANQIIIINSIEVFNSLSYANSQNDSNIPGVTPEDLSAMALVLYVNGEESIFQVPLPRLNNMVSNDANDPSVYAQTFAGFEDLTNVDFDKSYVKFSDVAQNDFVIPFGVSYARLMRNPGGDFS